VSIWRARHRVATTAVAVAVVGAALAAPTASGQVPGGHTVASTQEGVSADAVTTAAAGTATGGKYSFLSTWGGKPVRWDPCAPITYRVNLNRSAPAAEIRYIQAAFAELGRSLGGVRFVYTGVTGVVPDKADDAKAARTNIVVAFAAPGSGRARSSMLSGREAGRGGFGSTSWSSGDGANVPIAKAGSMVVDARKFRTMNRKTRTALYLHEIGHVLGLGHASDRGQLMYPTLLNSGPRTYASGDRVGLKRLGKAAGCLQVPARATAPRFTVSGDNLVISVPAVRSVSGTPQYRLNSHNLVSLSRTSATPTFTIRRSAVGRGAKFSVTATNRVGQSTGPAGTFTG
jgi:hypothetical protein